MNPGASPRRNSERVRLPGDPLLPRHDTADLPAEEQDGQQAHADVPQAPLDDAAGEQEPEITHQHATRAHHRRGREQPHEYAADDGDEERDIDEPAPAAGE